MALSEEGCIPCRGEEKPLSAKEIEELLPSVLGWSLREDGKALTLKRQFKNFKQSLDFVNKVGDIAENEQHHPDIAFGWGYADITLQTHSIDGLQRNDFIVAAKINQL